MFGDLGQPSLCMMRELVAVFNYLEDKVQQRVLKFVHFVNVASGVSVAFE